MNEYLITFIVDASIQVTINASSANEAVYKALETVRAPSLCHHCARKLTIGDVLQVGEIEQG